MPRFTEQEKEIINRKLLIEGEKLFAAHGLKKVTVDDLAIKGRKYENHRDLTKDVITLGVTGLINSPILSQIDLSLMDYLQRKLSPDIFDSHMHNDIHILEMLEDLGVIFTIPHTVIIKSLYSVLSCLEQFKEDKELNMIQNLLVNGIVQQVVAE